MLPRLHDGAWASSPEWVSDLCRHLQSRGVVETVSPVGPPAVEHPLGRLVSIVGQTALADRVKDQLARLGVQLVDAPGDGAFVLADLSGRDRDESTDLVSDLHRRGCSSMAIWRRGPETFYGPWAEPRRTACWNCCLLRFSDSIAADGGVVDPHPRIVRVVAENAWLAVHYPEVAPRGCVLVDDGVVNTLHSVVPMPWCPVCGGAAVLSGPLPIVPRQSRLVPEELAVLADSRAGIVRHLFIFDGDRAGAPAVPRCASASIAPYEAGSIAFPASRGEGKGATRDGATWSAIGEGLERYAASLWEPAALQDATFEELSDAAFDPRWLVLYGAEQYASPGFPYAQYRESQAMPWVWGQWLNGGAPVAIPAFATFMNFPVAQTALLAQTSSNGLAAGASYADAALRALYELIERDAFMLYWLARRPARRVAEDGCDPVTRQALDEVRQLGAQIELYLLDTGTGHPTIICLGVGDGESWPGLTVGLAAHADPSTAMQRAVLEHSHCGCYIRRLMTEGRHRAIAGPEDVRTGLDHALYYVDPARTVGLDAFRGGGEPPALLDELRAHYRQPATLEACVATLEGAGIRTAAVDVTSPDVALGRFRVVRAFGSYLQPIHFGHGYERPSNPRLARWLTGPVETNPHPLA